MDIAFNGKYGDFISHEVYYLLRIQNGVNISLDNMTANEKNTFRDLKWWSLEELKNSIFEFEPRQEILQLLERNK